MYVSLPSPDAVAAGEKLMAANKDKLDKLILMKMLRHFWTELYMIGLKSGDTRTHRMTMLKITATPQFC